LGCEHLPGGVDGRTDFGELSGVIFFAMVKGCFCKGFWEKGCASCGFFVVKLW
jgi:hypothetical protein